MKINYLLFKNRIYYNLKFLTYKIIILKKYTNIYFFLELNFLWFILK